MCICLLTLALIAALMACAAPPPPYLCAQALAEIKGQARPVLLCMPMLEKEATP